MPPVSADAGVLPVPAYSEEDRSIELSLSFFQVGARVSDGERVALLLR